MTRYIFILPAVLLAAAVALYAWAAYDMRPAKGQEDWQDAYN